MALSRDTLRATWDALRGWAAGVGLTWRDPFTWRKLPGALWAKLHPWVRFALIAAALWGLYRWGLPWLYSRPWTGFGDATLPKSDKLEYRPTKTLWDWLGLLVIPAALAGAGLWFTHWKERRDREDEERRREEERRLERDRLREEVLRGYLDRMADLMLHENWDDPKASDLVRNVARSRTLLALRRLDGRRKGLLLRFLHESGLILRDNPPIRLYKADLRGAILHWTDLNRAALNGVDLRNADLKRAALYGTDLAGADLRGADLRGAFLGTINDLPQREVDLGGANLEGADLSGAQLFGVDLSGLDLSRVRGLTQDQIDSARGNATTQLPDGLTWPASWGGPATP